jgi:Erv1/Alr family protein
MTPCEALEQYGAARVSPGIIKACREGPLPVSLAAADAAKPDATWGPKLWAALHTRPRLWTDATAERVWLTSFSARIRGGCSCRAEWVKIVTDDPPDLSCPEAYFEWGVRAHNAVNRKLGKPELGVVTAWERWLLLIPKDRLSS